jgi:hypothetical protein
VPPPEPIEAPVIARMPEPPPPPKPAPPPEPLQAPVIARAPEPPPPLPKPKPAPPKLGPAAALPALVPKKAAGPKRRAELVSGIALALAIGAGSLATGAFIGFLVNGPPVRALPAETIAQAMPSPPSPAPTTLPLPAPVPRPVVETRRAAVVSTEPPPPPPPPVEEKKIEAASPPEPTPQLATNEVREVQGRLRALGYNPGPVDGAAGPQTTAAVKQYQQARGLGATGTADKEVLERLRQEQPAAPQQAQAPPPRPQRYAAAPPPPPPRRETFLDSLERLFRR